MLIPSWCSVQEVLEGMALSEEEWHWGCGLGELRTPSQAQPLCLHLADEM